MLHKFEYAYKPFKNVIKCRFRLSRGLERPTILHLLQTPGHSGRSCDTFSVKAKCDDKQACWVLAVTVLLLGGCSTVGACLMLENYKVPMVPQGEWKGGYFHVCPRDFAATCLQVGLTPLYFSPA